MEKKYTLLRSQKNRVFKILREEGLEPADFKWTECQLGGSIDVSRLDYRDGVYYFQFTWYELNSWCLASPGRYRALEYEHPNDWEEQETCFRNWARHLKREFEAPDIWAQMEKYKVAFSATLPEKLLNEPISAYEAEGINERVSILADKMEEQFGLPPEQIEFVRSKLGYLAEAAKRQRSADWVYTSLGVAVAIAMGLDMAQNRAEALWKLMESELGEFIHLTTA